MKTKRLVIYGFLVTVLASLFAPLFMSTGRVRAEGDQATWVDSGNISYKGESYIDNKPADDSHQFHLNGNDDRSKCVPVIKEFNNPDATKADKANLVTWKNEDAFNGICTPDKTTPISIDTASATANAGKPASTTGGKKTNSCESKGILLSWILCPVIKLMDVAINWIDTQIQALLEVDKTVYDNPELYAAWSQMRNIAFIILIPMMLIMVLATAMGSELISAYQVKKALPRMAGAIIFIILSYALCTFAINVSNVVGGGTLGILTQPFNHLAKCEKPPCKIGNTNLTDLFGGSKDGVLSFILLLPKLVAVVGGVALILFFFGGTILLFVLVAFAVLLVRQVLVVALMLIAPLAILHGKSRKLWWESFSKVLIMFPLIMALIAVGRDMAWIINTDDGRGGGLNGAFINPIAKLAFYLLPYALIPFTFKFAGGAFATISGMANNKSKGVFDRQKQKRAANWSGFKSGTVTPPGFRGDNIASQGMRRLGSGIGSGVAGRGGFGRRGRETRARMIEVAGADAAQNDKTLQQLGLNSDEGIAMAWLSGGSNAGAEAASHDLRAGWLRDNQDYQTAVTTGDIGTQRRIEGEQEARRQNGLAAAQAIGLNKAKSQAAGTITMQNKARAIGGGDWQSVQRGINRLHGDNAVAAADMQGTIQYFGREGGRADLGDTTVARGAQRAGAAKVVRGYTGGVQAVASDLTARHQANIAGMRGGVEGAMEAAEGTASEMVALRNAMGQDVSEDNKNIIFNMLHDAGVDVNLRETVDTQLGAAIGGDIREGQQEAAARIRHRAGLYDSGQLGAIPGVGGGEPAPDPPH